MEEEYKIIAITDSILAGCELPNWASRQVYSFNGATLPYIKTVICKQYIPIANTRLAIIHAGTNDVDNGEALCNVMFYFKDIVALLKVHSPSIDIVICSLLGRPKDWCTTTSFIRVLNKKLV